MCKMTPIGVRLNLKNFILISFAVMELLRKLSRGEESALYLTSAFFELSVMGGGA